MPITVHTAAAGRRRILIGAVRHAPCAGYSRRLCDNMGRARIRVSRSQTTLMDREISGSTDANRGGGSPDNAAGTQTQDTYAYVANLLSKWHIRVTTPHAHHPSGEGECKDNRRAR